jgi:hypothetical protein
MKNVTDHEEWATRMELRVQEMLNNLESDIKHFPDVEALRDRVQVTHSPIPRHTCRFCQCQHCSSVTVMDTKAAAEMAERTLANCNKYTKMLTALKVRLTEIHKAISGVQDLFFFRRLNMLTKPQSKRKLEQAPETDEALFDLSLAVDDLIRDVIMEVEVIPVSTVDELMYKARSASDLGNRLTRTVLNMVQQARFKLNDVKTQIDFAREVQQQLEKAEKLLLRTSVQVVRNRCGGKYLTTGM